MSARWPAALLVFAPLLVASPAAALSCVPLADQTPYSSFTGAIVQQRGEAYLFAVREVWSGPDLQERTWIRFDDSGYDPVPAIGEALVVFADEDFRANACTATPAGDGADRLRPDTVREPAKATWWSAIRTRLIGTSMLAPAPVIYETG